MISKQKRSSPKFKVFFRQKSEIQGFFPAEYWWSPNKKKDLHRNSKGFSRRNQKFKGLFPTEIRNSRVCFRPKSETQGFFSAECRWSPKKKGFHRNSNGCFRPKSEIQGFFLAECRWSPTKKRSSPKFKRFFWPNSGDLQKIGLYRLWVSSWTKQLHYSGPNNGKSFTTSAPKSLWGGCFHVGAKIGLKSTRNVLFCIFFRPIGKARAPHPPPWLRYKSIVDNSYILIYSIYFVSLSTANKPTTLKLANFVCSWCLGRS